jgi:hypothetical protein
MWGAQCCWALHAFTFRRREGRLADVLDLLVDAADLGVPLLRTVAVLAAAEAGDPDEARRLQRRWPAELPRDWTTDALVVARAWLALALDGDLAAAYADLLPYAGRQVVVGRRRRAGARTTRSSGRLAGGAGRATPPPSHLRPPTTSAGRSSRRAVTYAERARACSLRLKRGWRSGSSPQEGAPSKVPAMVGSTPHHDLMTRT